MESMAGISAALFAVGLVASLGLVYSAGLTGWTIGATSLGIGWICILFFGWADPALLVVELLCAGMVLSIALRWNARHRAWMMRIQRDRREGDEKQKEISNVTQGLKEKMMAKAAEVERGLKQYELVRRLAEAVSWEEMSPALEKALKTFFRVEGWALYLTDEKNELKLVQRRGATPEPRAGDATKHEPFLHTFVVEGGSDNGKTVWAVGLPLWRLHERIGQLVMRVPEWPKDQTAAMLSEIDTFGVQLIFAMAKAKLYRELDERSRTDGLTGLSRRGPFEERLKEEVARASSFHTTFSVLMIDIDHFKHLNDSYGHQVGDEVLRTVSQRLRDELYETDMIARYGGEEFVCIMPRSDAAGLKVKAERIRDSIASEAFVIGLEAIAVTISIGIAHFPHDGNSAQSVMAAADRALYAAKAAGRNCVMAAAA